MYKWIMSILFFGACAFGLIFLMVSSKPEISEDEIAAEPGKPQLRISASNFKFDQPEYRVKQGETVQLVVRNAEGTHGIDITQLGISLKGSELSKEVTFDKAGTYDIICNVPCGTGHVDMKAKLIVE